MMNNPQENQQAQCYQNHWWEVELARKDKRIAELEARLENAELEKATAEEAEALSRFRAERATVKMVPTTVRTEWYGQMW